MFKTLKRWLGFKDKMAEALVKLLETSSNDAKVGNTISSEEMLAKLKDQPPKAPTTRSVRGDRRPPEPPPAPPMRTHHVTRSAPDPYYNTVLNNPILFVDALPRSYSSSRDCDCDSYKSSGSSSCDSGSSSSDSRSSSSD